MLVTRVITRAAAPLLVAAGLALVPPAHAAPTTVFELPFPCGESWTGSTRSSHSPSAYSVDFNRTDDFGDPVVASAAGTVKVADTVDNSGYGKWIQLTHGNDESTIYAHLNGLVVKVGQQVEQGELIGYLGTTGRSTGPHLHYEQRKGSTVLRPYIHAKAYVYGTSVSQNCPVAPTDPGTVDPEPAPEPLTNVPLAANAVLDAKADLTIFRRVDPGRFRIRQPGTKALGISMGTSTDVPLLGHWDGGSYARPGYFRPSTNTFVLRTAGGNRSITFGQAGDVPLAGDWDGDGTTDIGVRRGSTFIKRMADGATWTVNLGATTDVPVIGDWNRDRIADLGVYTPSTSRFRLRVLGTTWKTQITSVTFGAPGTIPSWATGTATGSPTSACGTRATATFSLRRTGQPTNASSWTQRIRFGPAQG